MSIRYDFFALPTDMSSASFEKVELTLYLRWYSTTSVLATWYRWYMHIGTQFRLWDPYWSPAILSQNNLYKSRHTCDGFSIVWFMQPGCEMIAFKLDGEDMPVFHGFIFFFCRFVFRLWFGVWESAGEGGVAVAPFVFEVLQRFLFAQTVIRDRTAGI